MVLEPIDNRKNIWGLIVVGAVALVIIVIAGWLLWGGKGGNEVGKNTNQTFLPAQNDKDGDSLTDEAETKLGFDPAKADFNSSGTDSDGDGLIDETETTLGTDPNVADTDGDGLSDYSEIDLGTNPLVKEATPVAPTPDVNLDTDKDGLTDIDEATYGTDKNNPDTDGDSYLDGEEVKAGYNPLGPGKLPVK